MEFKIASKNFVQLLEKNEKIITKSITFPILSYVLIEANKDILTLYTTDYELNFKTYTKDVEILKEGKTCVAGKELLSFLKGIKDKNIYFVMKDGFLVLQGKSFEIKLKTINPEDYPLFPVVDKLIETETKLRAFKKALRETYQSATIIETRPEISGFLIKGESEDLKIVATDSFRLAESTILEGNKSQKDFEAIISYRVGRQLFNLLDTDEGDIKIIIGKNQIETQFNNAVLVSRLIEGRYPDYKKIVPNTFITNTVVSREIFLESLKRVSIFSTKINDVRLSLSKNELTLISKNPDLGESSFRIGAKTEGECLDSTFNYKYLIEGINQIESDKIRLNFVNKEKPLLIQPLEDASYMYLVMPIREV